VVAARAVVERDANGLVAAARSLGSSPHPVVFIDVVRLAAAQRFDTRLAEAAAGLRTLVVNELRACEDAGVTAPVADWMASLVSLATESTSRRPTKKE
jgi:hypothetical protein